MSVDGGGATHIAIGRRARVRLGLVSTGAGDATAVISRCKMSC